MTFDPKSLLTAPPAPPPKPMTVDDLARKFAQISAAGMGQAPVALPDGGAVNTVELVAGGEVPAHFVLRHKE